MVTLIMGISGSAVVYFKNTSSSPLVLRVGWTQSANDSQYYDRIFWYSGNVEPSAYNSGNPTTAMYQLTNKYGNGNNLISTLNGTTLETLSWNNFNGMTYANNTFSGSGTQDMTIQPNSYAAIMIAGDGGGDSTYTITGFNAPSNACVLAGSSILMYDFTTKMIENIQRGDMIIEDKETNKTAIVSRVIQGVGKDLVVIPQGLMNCEKDLIITPNHPVWVNANTNRILAKNLKGVEEYNQTSETVFNLQFDEEGSFYANGVKIDSVSPYHKKIPLGKNNFIDESKYKEGWVIYREDDIRRGKPKLIDELN